jgi:hypothetical protein
MLAPLLLAAAPVGQSDGALTLNQVRAMPLPALSQRLLGRPGTEFREVLIFESFFPGRRGGWEIVFVEPPRFSGFAGICEAKTVAVNAYPPVEPPALSIPGGDTPLTLGETENVARFKIVTDTPGGPVTDAAERQRLESVCAAAGPVLDSTHYEWPAPFFPVYGSPSDFDMFVRALRAGEKEAELGAHLPECERDVVLPKDPMCRNPAAALARLDWRRLEGVEINTDPGKPPQLTHATFYFRRSAKETPRADHVHVEIGAFVNEGRPQIESIKITGVTYVD